MGKAAVREESHTPLNANLVMSRAKSPVGRSSSDQASAQGSGTGPMSDERVRNARMQRWEDGRRTRRKDVATRRRCSAESAVTAQCPAPTKTGMQPSLDKQPGKAPQLHNLRLDHSQRKCDRQPSKSQMLTGPEIMAHGGVM